MTGTQEFDAELHISLLEKKPSDLNKAQDQGEGVLQLDVCLACQIINNACHIGNNDYDPMKIGSVECFDNGVLVKSNRPTLEIIKKMCEGRSLTDEATGKIVGHIAMRDIAQCTPNASVGASKSGVENNKRTAGNRSPMKTAAKGEILWADLKNTDLSYLPLSDVPLVEYTDDPLQGLSILNAWSLDLLRCNDCLSYGYVGDQWDRLYLHAFGHAIPEAFSSDGSNWKSLQRNTAVRVIQMIHGDRKFAHQLASWLKQESDYRSPK